MKAQFIVTVEGSWLYNGQPATHAQVEKAVREAVKDQFEFLADRVTVKRQSTSPTAKTQENNQ